MIALWLLLGLIGFWVFYLAAMNLLRAKAEGKLSGVALCLGYPVIFVGALIDLVFNATLFSLIFLELPREWMLTQRLKRHIKSYDFFRNGALRPTRRKRLALWICRNLLNPFDHTGDHCD